MTLLPNTSVGSNDFGQKQNIWDIGDYIVKCNFLAQFKNIWLCPKSFRTKRRTRYLKSTVKSQAEACVTIQ
jgi:hypothetical protein